MTTTEAEREVARQKLVEVAQGMLNESIDLVQGCRSIARLRIEADFPASSAFNSVLGIESETDDCPLGELRTAYTPELLKRLDSEVSTYTNAVKPDLLEACHKIIRQIEALQTKH